MNELQEKLNLINEEASKITPEVLKKDLTVFNITGTLEEGITPTGTLSITENGTYDVKDKANVDVNVQGGGGGAEEYFNEAPTETKGLFTKYSSNIDCLFYPGIISLIKKLPSNIKLASSASMFWYHISQYIPQEVINNVIWDTTSVTTFYGAFAHNKNWTELDLSSFRTENATTFQNMFYDCAKLTKLNLKNFNPVKVGSSYSNMFYGVPTTCEIITNQTMATWISNNFSSRASHITIVSADWEV